MNKSLLIHNDNVPSFACVQKIKFELKQPDVDKYISSIILDSIKKYEYDVIYIKDSLSQNYLAFYGLRVAHHIRLSSELGDKRFLPIVILSDTDSHTLNKLSKLARILFTQNIFLIPNTKEAILKLENNLHSKKMKYQDFLNTIEVEKPEQSTNHDIANEWAIYRWAEFIGVKSDAIIENNRKISTLLYFKYLVAKYPFPLKNGLKKIPHKTSKIGKILYIDDEWHKGWSDIFSKYFENCDFHTVEKEYKNKSVKDILEVCKDAIRENLPDIVLLDMRLHQDDHNNALKASELTGMKVLESIKEINKGIQVILLTASGKSTILEEATTYGILGYIKKDHPQDNEKIEDKFKKLVALTEKGFERSYLKKIWDKQNEMLSLKIFNQQKFAQIQFEIKSVYEILDSNIDNSFKYAMFAIYKCIELINDYYITEENRNGAYIAYFNSNNTRLMDLVGNGKLTSERNKTLNVLKKLHLYNLESTINDIVEKRNSSIHSNRNPPKIIKDDIELWFTMLYTILIKIDNAHN